MTVINELGLRVCQCEQPSEHPNPIKAGTCVKCSSVLSPFWLSTDQTINEWWDRLRMGMFYDEPPAWFNQFREEATKREREGRDLYGLRFIGRDNLEEAVEELADFVNYIFFDSLNAIRREGHDSDIDVALTAVAKATEAFEQLRHLQARRRGAP